MLHLISKNVYSGEDWKLMQNAHAEASALLDRDPYSDINANRLARIVMRLFDQHMRDEKMMATLAAREEAASTNHRPEIRFRKPTQ